MRTVNEADLCRRPDLKPRPSVQSGLPLTPLQSIGLDGGKFDEAFDGSFLQLGRSCDLQA